MFHSRIGMMAPRAEVHLGYTENILRQEVGANYEHSGVIVYCYRNVAVFLYFVVRTDNA